MSFCNEKKLHIYMIEQVLDPSGTKMLMWQQVKKIREQRCSEKKAAWFVKLEQELLAKNTEIREIKEVYKKPETNNMVCKTNLRKSRVTKEEKSGSFLVQEIHRKNAK